MLRLINGGWKRSLLFCMSEKPDIRVPTPLCHMLIAFEKDQNRKSADPRQNSPISELENWIWKSFDKDGQAESSKQSSSAYHFVAAL